MRPLNERDRSRLREQRELERARRRIEELEDENGRLKARIAALNRIVVSRQDDPKVGLLLAVKAGRISRKTGARMLGVGARALERMLSELDSTD